MSVRNLVLAVILFILAFAGLVTAVVAGGIPELLGALLTGVLVIFFCGYLGLWILKSCDRIEQAGQDRLFSEIAAQTARFRRRAQGRRR